MLFNFKHLHEHQLSEEILQQNRIESMYLPQPLLQFQERLKHHWKHYY